MRSIPISCEAGLILPCCNEGVDSAAVQQTETVRAGLTSAVRHKVPSFKKRLLPVAAVCVFASSLLAQAPTPTATPLAIKYEQYGTAPTGVPLSWKAIEPDSALFPGPRPAVLGIH